MSLRTARAGGGVVIGRFKDVIGSPMVGSLGLIELVLRCDVIGVRGRFIGNRCRFSTPHEDRAEVDFV